jgi:integrase
MGRQKHLEFTSKRVAMLQHGGGSFPTFHWDGGFPGLGLRITPAGARSFIYQGMLNGKSIRLTIGDISTWTVAQARSEARQLANSFDRGIDPRAVKAEQRAAKERAGIMVADAWERYLAAHKGIWSERHMRDHEYLAKAPQDGHVTGIVWPLLQKSLMEFTQGVVKRWAEDAIADFAKRQAIAESSGKGTNIRGRNNALLQAFIRLRAFWRWCCERQDVFGELADPQSIFGNSDLKMLIPKAGVKNDVLEKGQLASWFAAVRGIQNPVVSAYLQVLLLTGARRNELGKLKWDDADFQWRSMWVHDKVEGEAGRKIPLTPYVAYLLSRLPRRNEWVFSSPTSESGRLMEPRIAHQRACDAAGVPRVSIHGLRRSFASLSEWVEMPVGIVAQIMGHKPSATAERHYKRRPLDLLALWHDKLEAWILEQAGVHFDAEVVETGLHVV